MKLLIAIITIFVLSMLTPIVGSLSNAWFIVYADDGDDGDDSDSDSRSGDSSNGDSNSRGTTNWKTSSDLDDDEDDEISDEPERDDDRSEDEDEYDPDEEIDPEERPEQFDLSDDDAPQASDIVALNLDRRAFAKLQSSGIKVLEEVRLPNLKMRLTRLSSEDGLTIQQTLQHLREQSPDSFTESNATYRLASTAKKACQGIRCYGAKMTGLANTQNYCERPIRVGMIDSAVQAQHAAFDGQSLTTKTFSQLVSEDRHGTAIASQLIGNAQSEFPGLVPWINLYAADVFEKSPETELTATVFNIVKALDWLVSQKVKVINISMAGPENGLLRNAISRATQNGILITAAAGNGGPSAEPVYPAAYHQVLAVTAVDRHQQAYGEANLGRYIDVAAPGVSIWVPYDNHSGYFDDGTSYATVYATAASAIIFAQNPSISPEEVILKLQRDAKDLGAKGHDSIYGWGLLQNSSGC